jgi:NUMOD3 motif
MYGRTHIPESKAQMSDSKLGANNPMYGKVAVNAMTINVNSLDGKLIKSFSSQTAAAKWLNIPRTTFLGYLSSGKVWNNQYIFLKI